MHFQELNSFTYEDKNKFAKIESSFNFAILASHGEEKYADICFMSPMIFLQWYPVDVPPDLLNDPESFEEHEKEFNYKPDLKLFMQSTINTKKIKNIRINSHVSALIAKVEPTSSACNLYLNIRGIASIFEGAGKEKIWMQYFQLKKASQIRNYFIPFKDEEDVCMIKVDACSCKLISYT